MLGLLWRGRESLGVWWEQELGCDAKSFLRARDSSCGCSSYLRSQLAFPSSFPPRPNMENQAKAPRKSLPPPRPRVTCSRFPLPSRAQGGRGLAPEQGRDEDAGRAIKRQACRLLQRCALSAVSRGHDAEPLLGST